MSNTIELREINKLIKERFYIPTYQRGYRWGERQVQELLEDIYEFKENGNVQAGEFYCLQPVVVKKRNDETYEVIDGQQRLTTFMIIQKFLNKRTFHIQYASRAGSEIFLENIKEIVEADDDQATRNIDFFFMKKAFLTIKEWFDQKIEETEEYSLEDEFNTYLCRYCKVIWYEVDDSVDAESIFTRLNIGKIPLTNAELIKALFLRKSNFVDMDDPVYLRQLEIANEWDAIENALQNNKLWYFINPPYEELPATRIEYIFDIVAKETSEHSRLTFTIFAEKLKEQSIGEVWDEVKNVFGIIKEWYSDQTIYHLIGFLTSSRKRFLVSDLIEEYYSKEYRKSEFLCYLKGLIREYFSNIDIESLSYESPKDKERIRDVLLLFNILTVMNKTSAYSRFPFDSYNKNAWSIEHIHAQNAEGIRNRKELWLSWLDEHIRSFKQIGEKKYKKIIEELESVDRRNLDADKFEDLFNSISEQIKDDYGIDLHKIDNLALLDGSTNSAIGNDFFDVKRIKIVELDRAGAFIPICTRNVFLKYYSSDSSQIHYWSESDRNDYFNAIKTVLSDYLPKEA